MRGPEEAKALTVASLKAATPARLNTLRVRYGISREELPDIASWSTTEVPRLEGEEWPAAMVVARDAPRITQRETDGLDTIYDVTYTLRIYVWVRGEGFEDTVRRRDRTLLAIRESLLADVVIGTDAVVGASSLRESYADVSNDRSGRSVSAAFLEAAVTLGEIVSATEVATADEIDLVESLLPRASA